MTWQRRKRCQPACKPEADQTCFGLKNALTVFAAATVCYAPSINGDFVFDDTEAIVRNPVVQNKDFRGLLTADFWGRNIRSPDSHKSYRPITTLTFMSNHAFSTSPFYYHFVNIILHGFVSVLVLKVVNQMCERFEVNGKTAFYAAILFAVHPVHSEAVANIVGRAELLMAFFGLLSLSLYLRHDNIHTISESFAFVLLNALSVFSKEQGVTFLAMSVSFDIMKGISSKSFQRKMQTINCALLALTFCLLRHWINGFQYPQFSKLDNPIAHHGCAMFRAINYLYLYLLNMWLLIFPRQLCFDYSMGCIPLITKFSDRRLLAFIGYPLLLLCSEILRRELNTAKRNLVIYAVVLAVLSFLPASNIISVGFVIAERVLYVPSIGYCVLIGAIVHHLEDQLNSKQLRKPVILICLLMASKCTTRAYEWNTEKELFSTGISVCPNNAKIYYNLAKVMADSGDVDSAERNYLTALDLKPDYEQALNNIANIYERRGENMRAIDLLKKCLKANRQFATAWMNLGVNQMAIGDFEKALISFSRAVILRPYNADAYFNLGNLHMKQKRYADAEQCWRNATTVQPSHRKAWTNLLVLLEEQNECNEVERLAPEAMRQLVNTQPVQFQLAICQAKLKKFKESEQILLSLLDAQPNNVLYRTNIGVLYERWNKPHLAISAYEYLSKIQQNDTAIEQRIQKLHKRTRLR